MVGMTVRRGGLGGGDGGGGDMTAGEAIRWRGGLGCWDGGGGGMMAGRKERPSPRRERKIMAGRRNGRERDKAEGWGAGRVWRC